VTLIPTHSLELIEAAAAQDAVEQRRIEPRESPHKPLDVLVQHLVSMALGGGFLPEELYEEVRGAWAYRDLTVADWSWALAFVRHGGLSLTAYPDYRRVEPDEHGVWRVPDARLARRHRMSIGTIVSDASIQLKFWSKGGGGKQLGSVEEGFISRLKPGDGFLFAGRLLELVRVENMTAYVKRSIAKKAAVPRWNGGRMPLSNELAQAVVERFSAASQGEFVGPEMRALRPLLEVQQRWSGLPTSTTLLAEALKSREGWHLFLYPFAGRQVHLGLASVLAWRVSQQQAVTFSIAVNDYGLELLSATPVDWPQVLSPGLLSPEHLLEDVLASLNAGELALRRFREIARIAGLVFAGYPGAPKSTRQVQASSGLFFEVFKQYDAGNLLLAQAGEEVLREELDIQRLEQTLKRINRLQLDLHQLKRPTPLGFPLLVERMRESMSSEKLADRIRRMVTDLEKTAETGKS
jgi:ATP-dependent Lhr-like helicase